MPRRRALLALPLILMLAQASTAAPGDPGCQFDFDGDGVVTQQDLEACVSQLQIFPPIYNPACDGNGDGILSTSDLAEILPFIGLSCVAPVPLASDMSRGVFLTALLITGTLLIRVRSIRRRTD